MYTNQTGTPNIIIIFCGIKLNNFYKEVITNKPVIDCMLSCQETATVNQLYTLLLNKQTLASITELVCNNTDRQLIATKTAQFIQQLITG